MSAPTPLNYAPPPPVHQRRVFRRMTLVVCLFAFVASGWWWAPPAWRRIQLLNWQHRCMQFSSDPSQKAFDLATNTNAVPVQWTTFYSMYSPPGFRSFGTLFLGEMKNPDGHPRLVALDLTDPWSAQHEGPTASAAPEVQFREFIPGDLFNSPHELMPEHGRECLFGLPGGEGNLNTVMKARRDPNDPTHLQFNYIIGGLKYSIDCWLGKDGEKPAWSPQ